MSAFPIITTLTAVPLTGAFAVLGTGARSSKLSRALALGTSLVALALTLVLWHQFDGGSGALQFEEVHPWIAAIGVEYHVGIDGLGLLMVLLSAIVVPMSIGASWQVEEKAS